MEQQEALRRLEALEKGSKECTARYNASIRQPETLEAWLREYQARLSLTKHGFERRHVIAAQLPDGRSIVVRGQRYLFDHQHESELSAISLEVPNEIAAEALRQALLKVQEPPAPKGFASARRRNR
jgi:hypothetical protein